ncbi:circular bacteriocin, circularin A/uberolysin family [Carnobacterium sp. 17-4]|uniref:uberolysin/carnocyclin family circular bacteriocin n=1 Tax=Carnobacterium sp. (strain 17-4) TaxID=208596 RepID=UPI00020588D6|nr:uberolysin/carnocyclin family circular bacteriocin [Carnobacterium sp. 17-4]AEB28839.1 circular bacteriocin, circularin A/uberolysin family [Carnobacterium sp. 17-4]
MIELTMELMNSMNIGRSTATHVIDLAVAGASAWAIVASIAAGGGIIAIGAVAVRTLIKSKLKKLGYTALVAW